MLMLLLLACRGSAPEAPDPGQAPVVQLTVSPGAGWVDEGRPFTLGVLASDDRDTPEALVVSVRSSLDGELARPLLDAQGRADLVLDDLSVGTHEVVVEAVDRDGRLGASQAALVVNGLPGAPVVAFASSAPTAAADLVLQVLEPGLDPEGGPVTYEIRWSLDGEVQDLSGTAVPAELLATGQDWTVELTSVDSYGSTGGTAGARTLIYNGAPEGAEVKLLPDAPEAGDALVCSVAAPAVDPEGDAVHYRIRWWLDGEAWPEGAGTTAWPGDTVPATETLEGQAWTCELTATDYISDAEPVQDEVLVGAVTAPLGEVDPLAAWTHLLGEEAGDRLGTALVVADLTGDGLPDLVAGAPGWDEDRGLVAVVPGGSRGDVEVGATNGQIHGVAVGDELGTALHAADLDGDGFVDLLVGVPGAEGSTGAETGGAWWMPGPLTEVRSAEDAAVRIVGATDARAELGASVASLPTHEGLLLALVAPLDDDARGALWLVPAAGLDTETVLGPDSTGRHDLGSETDEGRSAQATRVGDLDGDGLDDLAVGLPGLDSGTGTDLFEPDVGAIYLLTDSSTEERAGLSVAELSQARWTSQAQRRLGRALASGGDVDGDGLDDLLACAPSATTGSADDPVESSGQALLLPGGHRGARSVTEAPTTWSGLHEGLDLCDSIVGDLDLDGDGSGDLAFASSFADLDHELVNPGLTWIVYGPVEAGSWTTDDAEARLQGPSDNALLGSALAGGELTLDGIDDLVLGSRGWLHGEGETDYVGAAVVLSGGAR